MLGLHQLSGNSSVAFHLNVVTGLRFSNISAHIYNFLLIHIHRLLWAFKYGAHCSLLVKY